MTVDKNSANMKLDKIYPKHFGTLNKADLLKGFKLPTLEAKTGELEAVLKVEADRATKKRRERETGSKQSTLGQIQPLLEEANPQDNLYCKVKVPNTLVAISVDVVPPILQPS
jgi:hypothetical protein